MDATVKANRPLTREDLQEELRNFAQDILARVLREALAEEQQAMASRVRTLIDVEGSSNQKSKPAFFGVESEGSYIKPISSMVSLESKPSERSAACKNLQRALSRAYAPIPTQKTEKLRRSDLWKPSAKYEAQHVPQARSRNDANPKEGTEESLLEARTSSRDLQLPSDPAYSWRPLVSVTANGHEGITKWHSKLKTLMESSLVEYFIGWIVILNAISLGYDTNYLAAHPDGKASAIAKVSEPVFCLLFTTELLLRIAAFGSVFFCGETWRWNLFDAVLVAIQILEQALLFLSVSERRLGNLGVLRVLRLMRIIRFARLFRVIHLFDDLRVVVNSLFDSVASLLCSMSLLLVWIYVFSLVFLQSILSFDSSSHHKEELDFYFSSLFRTCLTMFECVVGGLNWDEVVRPLASDISPVMAVLFSLYIATCLFAMMNIMTGIFVDKAMTSVREDKDTVMARRVRAVFYNDDQNADDSDEVTWEDFQQKIETHAMRDYFAQINHDISEAGALFELMDADASGSLSPHEIVRSCLKLRGPARALELAFLTRFVTDGLNDMYEKVCNIETGIIGVSKHMEQAQQRS